MNGVVLVVMKKKRASQRRNSKKPDMEEVALVGQWKDRLPAKLEI